MTTDTVLYSNGKRWRRTTNEHGRILLLAADPVGARSLRLDAEARAIQQSLQGLTRFDVRKAWSLRSSDLRSTLLEYKPHIVHFSGGGMSEEITFQDKEGRLQLASAEALGSIFEEFSSDISCVVINSRCPVSQAEVICKHIAYVVGVGKLPDSAALEFAGAFYGALSTGKSIEYAFAFGQNCAGLTSPLEETFLHFPPVVECINLTPQILRLLAEDSEQLRKLSPEAFELLICNRLDNMGFDLVRAGANAYQKDGGIDIVAWPRASVVPLLMAVQVKHLASSRRKLGSPPIREFLGAVQMHGFNAGLLVTNTTFTPDARWIAEQLPLLLRLRDIEDLRRWLRDEHLRDLEWRDIPASIELCPGVTVNFPKSMRTQ